MKTPWWEKSGPIIVKGCNLDDFKEWKPHQFFPVDKESEITILPAIGKQPKRWRPLAAKHVGMSASEFYRDHP